METRDLVSGGQCADLVFVARSQLSASLLLYFPDPQRDLRCLPALLPVKLRNTHRTLELVGERGILGSHTKCDGICG